MVAKRAEGEQTLLVIDVREHGSVIAAVDDVLRRFEAGAPPQVGAVDLLLDIATALDESGPAIAGLTSFQWELAHKVTADTLKDLDNKSPTVQARTIERALRHVRTAFANDAEKSREAGTRRWRLGVGWSSVFLLFVVVLPLAVILGWLNPRWLWVEVVVLPGAIGVFKSGRDPTSDPDLVRRVAGQVAPNEELKFACRIERGIFSPDQVLAATDRRIALVEPGRGESAPRLLWGVPYSEVTAFTSERVSESSDRRVILRSRTQPQVIVVTGAEQASALSRILATYRPAAADPIEIRLDDSGFKKLRRAVHREARTDRQTPSD